MNTRKIAVTTLIKIIQNNSYNNIALSNTFKKNKSLTSQQRAFITDIVNGTLRNLLHIDYIINSVSNINTNKMDNIVLYTLRISMYEIFYTTSEYYAICNEAVSIVKHTHKHLAPFVNAVLRNVLRNKHKISYPNNYYENLSIINSIPMWIINYYITFLSDQQIKDFCYSSNKPPKVSLCVNTLITDMQSLLNSLKLESVDATLSNDKTAIYVTKTKNICDLQTFKNGHFHVMDTISMKVVETLSPKPNTTVYDVCAAPGGKSFYMAYLMKNTGIIYATDIHNHKINLIKNNAKRLGITTINASVNDATSISGILKPNYADYVLLDVPCSGLGTLRKKPDIKYTKTLNDIDSLANVQKEILKISAKYAKIGGLMLYSTCTISIKENQHNIKWFIKNHDYQLIQETQYMPTQDTDGFYTALLKRRS